MTDMREAMARAIVKANWPKFSESDIDEMWTGYLLEAEAALSLMQPEIDRRVAEERAKLLERLRDDLNIAIELIQEAKGYEGPKGGPITDHLDAAEGRIDRVLAQFEKENSHEQG